jgi:predicted GIY-YIG superfamily endonuclease
MIDVIPRRLFWCQEAEDDGDEPYFPEFLSPSDPSGWRKIHIPGCSYVYIMHTDRVRNPLYVGCTNNIANRLSQHRTHKAWWPLVDRIIVDCYEDRYQALEAEEQRIVRMRPLLNVVSNQHTVEVR